VHGLPGAFKNALDWLVSSGELAHKPVLVLNASPAGANAGNSSSVQGRTRVVHRCLLLAFARCLENADDC
jgi:NAD(P)H-dependent FMN reductase